MKEKSSSKEKISERFQKKEILYLGLVLFLICAVAGLLLGITYENTKDIIAAKKDQITKAAYTTVLPEEAGELTEVSVPEEYRKSISEAYRAADGSYAVKVQGKGYAGDTIEIAVGFSSEGLISGVTVISHSETPGLGAKASEPEFIGQFTGRTPEDTLKVVKNGAVNPDEIDAISGATKTSNGVTAAVNEACRFYTEQLKGGEANE